MEIPETDSELQWAIHVGHCVLKSIDCEHNVKELQADIAQTAKLREDFRKCKAGDVEDVPIIVRVKYRQMKCK